MKPYVVHAEFPGRVVMVGFGSIGQGVLPVLLRHIGIARDRIRIITADTEGSEIARSLGVRIDVLPLTGENYAAVLEPLLSEGDFLLNLSVDVSSPALIELCQRRGVLYLDTCIEPWGGGHTDTSLTVSARSNYALRERVLGFRRAGAAAPTAIVTQGANPGLASMFVKRALLNIAADTGLDVARPASSADWAELARRLEIRTIHVAERDTQIPKRRKQRGEFVNTWSVVAFVGESLQPAELGWGSHERQLPPDGARHGFGCDAAIYLQRPGAGTRVRSWTPLQGPYHGFLVTHAESISIADHLTVKQNGRVVYRPTVHYAYHPCDDAVLSLHELAGRNWHLQDGKRIIREEIATGMDELGVLLMGNPKGIYWYGSRLTIEEARRLAPHNSATSLQVVAGVLGGMVWAMRHPDAGIVEPDDIDFDVVLKVGMPYLGEVVGVYGDWTPLRDRSRLFNEPLDESDPWQFMNFRVT